MAPNALLAALLLLSPPPARVTFGPIPDGLFIQSGTPSPDATLPDEVGSQPQVLWIRSEAGFAKLGYSRRTAPAPGTGDSTRPAAGLDFSRQDVLLVSMGSRGTTGYSVTLAAIEKRGKAYHLVLKTRQPGPQDVVGEALTHPSVLVQTEKIHRTARLSLAMDGKDEEFGLRILE